MILSFFSNSSADYHKLAYDFNFKGLDGNQINLKNYNDKVIVGGYAKADDLQSYNYMQNKTEICSELGFDSSKPIITYAPAGEKSYMKPGGSLSKKMINQLEKLGENTNDYNILIKAKYADKDSTKKYLYNMLKGLFNSYRSLMSRDDSSDWDNIIQKLNEE